MDKDKLKAFELEYNYLIELCKYHKWLYYKLGTIIVDDTLYDTYEQRIRELERDYNFNRIDSPTKCVDVKSVTRFKVVVKEIK